MSRNIIRALLAAACAAGIGCAPGAAPPPAAGDGEYAFVPDTDRLVAIIRGHLVLVGTLDADGNFLEESGYRHKTNEPVFSAPATVLLNSASEAPRPAYEYRSGRLIKGVIDQRRNFVPDIGSTVTRFEDYRYSPDAVPIWNLPGVFVKKGELKEYLRQKRELKESLPEKP